MSTEAGGRLLTWLAKMEREDTDSQSWRNGLAYATECIAAKLPAIEAEARAAVLRELREEVADLSEWLSTCRCFVINPKFGEGQPGGHFTDCAWAQESDVRDEILAAIDRRLGE